MNKVVYQKIRKYKINIFQIKYKLPIIKKGYLVLQHHPEGEGKL
jgi:hypothetical protein